MGLQGGTASVRAGTSCPRMPSPPLGAGFVQILLMHRVPRFYLLPQIPTDALTFLVRDGLPIALRAPGFVRPLDRGFADGREKVDAAMVPHHSIAAESALNAGGRSSFRKRRLS